MHLYPPLLYVNSYIHLYLKQKNKNRIDVVIDMKAQKNVLVINL